MEGTGSKQGGPGGVRDRNALERAGGERETCDI